MGVEQQQLPEVVPLHAGGAAVTWAHACDGSFEAVTRLQTTYAHVAEGYIVINQPEAGGGCKVVGTASPGRPGTGSRAPAMPPPNLPCGDGRIWSLHSRTMRCLLSAVLAVGAVEQYQSWLLHPGRRQGLPAAQR